MNSGAQASKPVMEGNSFKLRAIVRLEEDLNDKWAQQMLLENVMKNENKMAAGNGQ